MKRFCIFALVAMMFAACTTDETQDVQFADAPETLTVGFEGGDDDTRVQLNEVGKTVWTKGDLVSVFYRSDANQQWKFQGETGDTNGKLKRISQGNTPNIGLDKVVAVYPYNKNYLIELQTGNIQALLPSAQEYTEDSYGIGSSIMISSSRTDKLYLKNVCGWLKLQLTGDATIDYITLKGNNGEQVAGNVFITADDASCTLASDLNNLYGDGSGDLEGTLIDPNTITSAALLDCGDGVTLSAEPTAFYIALPPQTFEKGVTVKIFDTSGKAMTKSTDKSLTIERNTIQPMAVFEANAEPFGTPALPTPANNEIYYFNGSFTEATTPYDTSVFGANIVSNLYDTDKECWVIKFDGDVTKIGDDAFYKCSSLKSVTIPDSVTSIGRYAFYYCESLTSITVPDSVTSIGYSAFYHCTSLTSVTIPNGVTSIGDYAFYNCNSLTSVTIPDSVTSIGSYAFYYCESLTSITIPDSVTSIGNYAFSGCSSLTSVTIPDSVTEIGNYAFQDCNSLTSVNIPDSVTKIGDMAFRACTSLTSVDITDLSAWCKISFDNYSANPLYNGTKLYINNTEATNIIIPSDITEIKNFAFDGCKSLTSVTIGNSVTSIGKYAFRDCTSLTSVTIPDSVTDIGQLAFRDCSSLTRVDITDLSAWCKISFDGSTANPLYNGAKLYINNTEATNITIPSDITEIKNYAFYNCTSLTSVNIPDSVTGIGNGAFRGCISLKAFYGKFATTDNRCLIINGTLNTFAIGCGATSYTIPDSVTSIGEYVFRDCTSLASVTIGNGVTSIGNFAFNNCESLKEVYCKPTTPPTGGQYMFDNNASDRKIYVPASKDDSIINAYKAKQYWSSYKSYIFEYDFSTEQ